MKIVNRIIIYILICVLSLEIGLKIGFYIKYHNQEAQPPGLYVSDDVLGYKLQQNFKGMHTQKDFSTNITIRKEGFRDNLPEKIDILVIGDSFTYGWGVNESKRFSNKLKTDRNIFDAGVPGYGTCEYEKILNEFSSKLIDNSVVLIGVSSNDVLDNSRQCLSRTVYNGKLYEVPYRNGIPKNIHLFLSRYIRLYYVGMNYIYILTHSDNDMWNLNEINLIKILNKSREKNAKLIFVLIYKKDGIEIMQKYKNFCNQNNMTCSDTYEILKEKDDYFEHDGHWTSKGHQKVSDLINKKMGTG